MYELLVTVSTHGEKCNSIFREKEIIIFQHIYHYEVMV